MGEQPAPETGALTRIVSNSLFEMNTAILPYVAIGDKIIVGRALGHKHHRFREHIGVFGNGTVNVDGRDARVVIC